jgi:arsenate reductase-like glutaredoxin family protein
LPPKKAGVSGDQMADIFKDIGDKIGAVLNKSGEAVDALNALGLSADKYQKPLQISSFWLLVRL